MSRDSWLRAALELDGFVGWVPWSACPAALSGIDRVAGGVYVVYRVAADEPQFLDRSPGGTWRGDPTVDRAALDANWVAGAHVMNIGKADHGQLRTRVKAYVGFGRGGKDRHYGGRLIWQLAESEELLIAWKILPRDGRPVDVETGLISAFRRDYGKPPFANNPHMLGR
jgi:hypothetical protein